MASAPPPPEIPQNAPGLAFADDANAMSLALSHPRFQVDALSPLPPPATKTSATILLFMALAIGVVTALAYWSEERESAAALQDFAREQTTLAAAIAAALQRELLIDPAADLTQPRSLTVADAVERPAEVRVFIAIAGRDGLRASTGEEVRAPVIESAARSGEASVRLSRAEAAALGLPARSAVAGLRRVATAAGSLTVVVVASARAERDRELRARFRIVLGLIIVSAIVVGFGSLAMRKQRTELELAHALALTTLQNRRDERLVRADKLATMGALATGIAHEVSTPLGVILGRAEQLLPKQLDERSRRSVEMIAAQTERINAVIRGFLALARGNQPILDRGDPAALARAAIELVEHRFEKADVALTTELAPALPRVSCDPRLFEQVLVNLLLNACDACEGGGRVELTVRREGAHVAFIVIDDGIGISPDAAERVTEPFFTTKPFGKGSGLGLAIANEIVKHHGGTLQLGSRASGCGTRAAVELPALTEQHG
jgi:two-component system NtrC family sensor kinase